MCFQHFNLFPASDRAGELHPGPDLGAQDAESRSGRDRHALSGAGQDPGAGQEVPGPAFRRSAAARGHRPFALHEPAYHALRRADVGPRPGDDRRGAGRDGEPCGVRHDDALRDPRNGLRPQGRQPGDLHGRRRDHRRERAGKSSSTIRSPNGPSSSSARSWPTNSIFHHDAAHSARMRGLSFGAVSTGRVGRHA